MRDSSYSQPQICALPSELVQFINPGNRIFVQGAAATPVAILEVLANDHKRLNGCEIIHLHTHGPALYSRHSEFKTVNLFVGENLRGSLDNERVDYLPCLLSEIPGIFRNRIRPLDVAIVQVSPPDQHGLCSLGTSVDIAKAAVDSARVTIAQINRHVPRTFGDGVFSLNRFTAIWEHDCPLIGCAARPRNEIDDRIAQHVASLIEDGNCLQMGIGAIPDAVLSMLKDRKHLGVHTEMFSDEMVPLIESGAVDNSRKKILAGKTVTSFINGTTTVFDFVNENPSVLFLESSYVNCPENIAKNRDVVAVNSAVEIDLTGQAVADSIGTKIISGFGGQMDFMRGAELSEGGKAILALPSRTNKGQSRIVNMIQPGAGVVTTRAQVQYVMTEYGIAYLYGRTLGERARALIAIAHPEDRERLTAEWKKR